MASLFTPIFAYNPTLVASLPKGLSPSNVLLTLAVRRTLSPGFLGQLVAVLAHSLFWLYLLMLALALVGLAAMFFLPGGRADKYAYHEEHAEEVEQPAEEHGVEITSFG